MADDARVVHRAIDALCDLPSNKSSKLKTDLELKCYELVNQAASLGLDEKQIISEAKESGLSESMGKDLASAYQIRQPEIRFRSSHDLFLQNYLRR